MTTVGRGGAVLLLSSDDVGVKARKGKMVDCECVGVRLLGMYVWYVSHCCVYHKDLCVDVFVWVGMCLIVYFWGCGGGSLLLGHM